MKEYMEVDVKIYTGAQIKEMREHLCSDGIPNTRFVNRKLNDNKRYRISYIWKEITPHVSIYIELEIKEVK